MVHFPPSTARNLETLFSYRQSGDDDAHIKFDRSEAEKGLTQAQEILDTVRKHLLESEGITLS